MIVRKSREHFYRENFIKQVREVNALRQDGKINLALDTFKMMEQDSDILPTERALIRNSIGVLSFSQQKYEQASRYFEQSLEISHRDHSLRSKVQLNLASSYYKSNKLKKSYQTLVRGKSDLLKGDDYKRYYKLRYVLANELQHQTDAVKSLIFYFKDKKNIADLKSDPLSPVLIEKFSRLERREKFNLLYDSVKEMPLVTGHLGYIELQDLYYRGDRERAQDLGNWLQDYFAEDKEIFSLIDKYISRLENNAKIDPQLVGVLLPLTGPRAVFGRRALLGIDSAMRKINKSLPTEKKIKLIIKDSHNNGMVGAFQMKELIENHFVSVVIGGLFSKTATREYLESRKFGVPYLGLAPIAVLKEQKSHLLIEIPGSIESQIKILFSEKFIKRLGKKVAIIYPEGDRGQSYLQRFWQSAKTLNIDVTHVTSFQEGKEDYQNTIRNLLGLDFIRERQEEFDLLSEIDSLERARSIRKIQILKPQIDFDWIFLPALPREAIQILPIFSYLDAFNVTIVGPPNWRTPTVIRESRKLKALYFVGDNLQTQSFPDRRDFIQHYRRTPKIVELMSYDAMMTAGHLIKANDYETRNELDRYIRSSKEIVGLTGKWKLDDGIWIKEMNILEISQGKVDVLL